MKKQKNSNSGYKSKADEKKAKTRFVSTGKGISVTFPDGKTKKA